MPPSAITNVLDETEDLPYTQKMDAKTINKDFKPFIIWPRVIFYSLVHILGLWGVFLLFSMKWYTIGYSYVNYVLSQLGVLAGAHRLWSHRAYKAKFPLKLALVCFNTLAFQHTILHWARDHRLHHKYSDTDADPHNINRGTFYSHIGWLFYPKTPLVLAKGKEIDVSDLYADSMLLFQKKYYVILVLVFSVTVPTIIPMYLWNESFINAFTANMLRYALNLNATFLVNSLAHTIGNKPYDKFMSSCQNLGISIYALGEGWHNYHHAFPWDYKASELGNYSTNFTTAFIDLMAKIGWAYDLRTASPETIKRRAERTGDGSHDLWGQSDKRNF